MKAALIEKVANIYVWENRKLGEAVTHQILAVVLAHYADPANVTDTMVEVFDRSMLQFLGDMRNNTDRKRAAIAAAMKAAKEAP